MSTKYIFRLIAITCVVVPYSTFAEPWAEINVLEPSLSLPADDIDTYTHVKNASGIYKVHIREKITCAHFSVVDDVIFQLFTPKNPIEPQILHLNDYASIKASNFNWMRPTRILIHGWYSEGLLTPRFADAYLTKGKHNVNFIVVNWQKGSDVYNYYCARVRVNEIGQHVARFVDFMSDKAWLRIRDLTIVGHSLGAHISGIVGKNIMNGKVGKIVGLDPAAPFFKYDQVENRLADTDASYVEVIYTSSGVLGYTQPIGATNFYPNGGTSQPGCNWDIFRSCAHSRSYEFYLESIVAPQFLAFECDSLEKLRNGTCAAVNNIVKMGGEPGNKKGKGIFYLETNAQAMFAKGREGIIQAVERSTKKTSMKLIMQKLFMINTDDKTSNSYKHLAPNDLHFSSNINETI